VTGDLISVTLPVGRNPAFAKSFFRSKTRLDPAHPMTAPIRFAPPDTGRVFGKAADWKGFSSAAHARPAPHHKNRRPASFAVLDWRLFFLSRSGGWAGSRSKNPGSAPNRGGLDCIRWPRGAPVMSSACFYTFFPFFFFFRPLVRRCACAWLSGGDPQLSCRLQRCRLRRSIAGRSVPSAPRLP